ncbi:hypothetical protein SETIT_1G314600v2 [Setaria italica]|uniref:Uncharacterized protein n=1 Tax=Setaria italica TaxID=4555 RepID=A0A368PR74_SETIT|nr:hypothetical protein SETIT_1G314600v2 [Setaria italica]
MAHRRPLRAASAGVPVQCPFDPVVFSTRYPRTRPRTHPPDLASRSPVPSPHEIGQSIKHSGNQSIQFGTRASINPPVSFPSPSAWCLSGGPVVGFGGAWQNDTRTKRCCARGVSSREEELRPPPTCSHPRPFLARAR